MIVDPDFFDHWKTKWLIDLLDGDEAAPIYLQRIWAHCQNRKETHFKPIPNSGLKAICKCPQNADKIASALFESGWLRRHEDDTIEVVGFAEKNAQLVANWENGSKGGRPRKNPSETHQEPNPEMGKPIREDKRREDKRREEKKEEEFCSEPESDSKLNEAIKDDETILKFPCAQKREWPLTQSRLDEYAEAFPGIDPLGEARKALLWLRDNPTRLKTFAGMPRFLSGWMSRAQNSFKPSGRARDSPKTTAQRLAEIESQRPKGFFDEAK